MPSPRLAELAPAHTHANGAASTPNDLGCDATPSPDYSCAARDTPSGVSRHSAGFEPRDPGVRG
jgi:hypothetical protein